jgi:hypothetical protein
MSHELITVLASVTPDEILIDQLEKALAEYKISGNLEDLGFPCLLINTKIASEKVEGGAMGMISDMKKMEKGMDLLSPKDS